MHLAASVAFRLQPAQHAAGLGDYDGLRSGSDLVISRAAQLEKLESKIEHLVNALASRQSSFQNGQQSPSQSGESTPRNDRSFELVQAVCGAGPPGEVHNPPTHTFTGPTPMHTAMVEIPVQQNSPTDPSNTMSFTAQYQSIGTSLMEANVLLDRYRRLMAPGFPFVPVALDTTAQQLYTEKPLLLRAIVSVACFHDLTAQTQRVKMFMRDVSERVLLNSEKNLGIIQAILVSYNRLWSTEAMLTVMKVFIAWYHPHVMWGQQATNLLHIAMAMVVDTGIDRPPGMCAEGFKAAALKTQGSQYVQRVATSDEYRALAGVWYLTSTVASSFRKIETMPYTRYMETCMTNLLQGREYENDAFLVQLVRLQRLTQEAQTTEASSAPISMYVKSFEAELDKMCSKNPCQMNGDNRTLLLQLQCLTAKIHIYELSLSELQQQESNKDATPSASRAHLENLYSLTQALGIFTEYYFTIPVEAYLTTSFAVWGQFGHAFMTLIKLATLEVDGWDFKSCNLDFLQLVEKATRYFDRSGQSTPDGLTCINDSFVKWANKLRWMKEIYEAKYMSSRIEENERQAAADMQAARPAGYDPAMVAGVQQPTPPDDWLPSSDFFGNLDDNFWNSFIGDADFGFQDSMMQQ